MPTFDIGITKTASATLSNPTGKSFTYDCELYLGAAKEVSALASIAIAGGAQGQVTFPITMPSVEGDWPVFLDVYVAGQLIAHYSAANVVTYITPDVVVGPITWV